MRVEQHCREMVESKVDLARVLLANEQMLPISCYLQVPIPP